VHVAIVGAGALGRVFGVRLATEAGVGVDFVVRSEELARPAAPFEIARVLGGETRRLESPPRVATIPPHADLVLLCVRSNQLDTALVRALAEVPDVPVVALTPMLPRTHERVRAALGGRLATLMSSVTGYTGGGGVTRYWISKTAATVVDELRSPPAAMGAFGEALGRAGIAARFEPGVHETSAATVLSLLPLLLGIDAAGSIDALLGDSALKRETFRAMDEGRALAERVGRPAGWVSMVTRFLGPYTVKLGYGMARSRSPEALAFVEDHFGRRARAQNVFVGGEAVALAAEKGTPREAMAALLARLS
jgi:ketopantoate reductase